MTNDSRLTDGMHKAKETLAADPGKYCVRSVRATRYEGARVLRVESTRPTMTVATTELRRECGLDIVAACATATWPEGNIVQYWAGES